MGVGTVELVRNLETVFHLPQELGAGFLDRLQEGSDADGGIVVGLDLHRGRLPRFAAQVDTLECIFLFLGGIFVVQGQPGTGPDSTPERLVIVAG